MTVELMPDPSRLRRSPLADRADELIGPTGPTGPTGGVALVELPFRSMVSVRVAPESAAARRVEQALGLALPEPGRVTTGPTGPTGPSESALRSVLWLGPDEWLVVGLDGDPAALVDLLTAALAEAPGSVVDVSANRDTLEISGSNARDLLEKGCTLDLHPRSFRAGHCAQTTFARGHVLIWQTADEPASDSPSTATFGPVYRFMFRSSFANYFADWLLDAAVEFRP